MRFKTALLPAILALVLLPAWASGAVKLPQVFSDHMVLQRDMPVPVWGTASAGEKVTVKFAGQERITQADDKGHWQVKLDPLKVGEPDKLIVSGSDTVTIQDVLVGEVWVGSGQSNMQMGAASYMPKDDVLVKNVAAGPYPKIRIISPHGVWQESTPANLPKFSALLFSFGLPLQKELDVPVGLMVGAVGGTPSGAWLTPEMYQADDACKAEVQQAMSKYDPAAEQKKYELDLANYQKAAAAVKPGQKAPPKPAAPSKPGEMPGGRAVGYLYNDNIKPYLPYAIRGVLWDQGESGTAVKDVDQYTLMGALIRGWRTAWGQGDFPFLYIQKPSGGGPAWDAKDPVTIAADKLAPLPAKTPGPADGLYRETHIRIRQYPNTFMVTSSDLGGATHPWNKAGYGVRASRVALGAVYSRKVEIYGPVYESSKTEGDKLRLTFTHVGQGLAAAGGQTLQGFEVAGEDKKFYWADAAIDGDTVILHADSVTKPVAARYAWGQTHTWANLFNKDGLPTQTFRTDAR